MIYPVPYSRFRWIICYIFVKYFGTKVPDEVVKVLLSAIDVINRSGSGNFDRDR